MKENTKSITSLYGYKGSSGASNECLHLIPEESYENLFPISLCQETQIEYQSIEQKVNTANYLKFVEVVYSAPKFDGSFKVNKSREAYLLLKRIWDNRKIDYKEFFYVLLLNRNNTVIGYSLVGVGSLTGTVVNVKEIFQLALLCNASGIVLAHNHPSGNLNPSDLDVKITSQIAEACKLIDVIIMDHIIMTSGNQYLSFSDEGLL